MSEGNRNVKTYSTSHYNVYGKRILQPKRYPADTERTYDQSSQLQSHRYGDDFVNKHDTSIISTHTPNYIDKPLIKPQ